MTSRLAEGDVLAGRFRLVRTLDSDDEPRLWVAQDLDLDEEVALLVVGARGDREGGELDARLRAACREARRLRHPAIVPVFDLVRDGDRWLVAREYVRGRSASTLQGLALEDARPLWLPVLDAFEYAHRAGIPHGGLTVNKVVVDPSGSLRVTDFAIAGALRSGAGTPPEPSDDVAALAALFEDLAGVGPGAETWTAALAKLRADPPGDIAALRRALGGSDAVQPTGDPPTIAVRARAPGAIEATPTPESIPPVRLPSRPPPAPAATDSSRNVWIGAAFGVLLVCALAVVFVLPRLVTPDAPPANAPRAEEGAAAAGPSTETASQEASPEDTARATRLLGEVLNRSEHLKGIAVEEWAPEEIAEVQAHVTAGEQAQAAGAPAEAISRYTQALETLDALDQRAEEVLAAALEAGAGALEARDPAEARRQFELARRVDPENATAELGLERAETLEQVDAALRSGEESEEAGELEAARDAFARAVELDSGFAPAVAALERVEGELRETEYERRMAIAVTALARRDLARADENAAAALALRPGSPEALDLRRSVQQKRLASATTSARKQAQAAEGREEWRKAADAYGRILELDPSQAFAREGFERADKRASMSKKFDAWIATPGLLFDDATRAEADRLLEVARTVPDPGPKLSRQVETMGALAEVAGTPIDVAFESDGLTRVDIRRVGTLGTFDRQKVSLKPGTYVVIGIRRGFRDVRRTVTVLPGQAPPPVVVRCEEKI